MDMTALAYLMKMEGSKKQELVSLTKDTWLYFLKRKITITAEFLLESMNGETNRAFKQIKDSRCENEIQ